MMQCIRKYLLTIASHVQLLEQRIEQLAAELRASRGESPTAPVSATEIPQQISNMARDGSGNALEMIEPGVHNYREGESALINSSVSTSSVIGGAQAMLQISHSGSSVDRTENSKNPPVAPLSRPSVGHSHVIEKTSPDLEEAEKFFTEEGDDEVTGINNHTHSAEFHGNTSSVAFLGYLQKKYRHSDGLAARNIRESDASSSLVSTLYNDAFLRDMSTSLGDKKETGQFYFRQAHQFFEGYFEQLHYIHPFLDRMTFMSRAEDLWFGRTPENCGSFIPLYLSIMSLGALIGVWNEDRIEGLDRFQWSRKLFKEAQLCLRELQFAQDLETVQCLIIMVCDLD